MRDGPSVLWLSISGASVCAIRLGLPRPRDGWPETDVPETDVPETEVPETDGPETDGAETDGTDVWRRRMSPRR